MNTSLWNWGVTTINPSYLPHLLVPYIMIKGKWAILEVLGSAWTLLETEKHQDHWAADLKIHMELNIAWNGPTSLENTLYWVLQGRYGLKSLLHLGLTGPTSLQKGGAERPGQNRGGFSAGACEQQHQSSSFTCGIDAEKAVPFVVQWQD